MLDIGLRSGIMNIYHQIDTPDSKDRIHYSPQNCPETGKTKKMQPGPEQS